MPFGEGWKMTHNDNSPSDDGRSELQNFVRTIVWTAAITCTWGLILWGLIVWTT